MMNEENNFFIKSINKSLIVDKRKKLQPTNEGKLTIDLKRKNNDDLHIEIQRFKDVGKKVTYEVKKNE